MSNVKLQTVRCPNHPEANLVEDYRAGDVICSACGLVIGDRVVDVGPEWRVFADDSNSAQKSRVGQIEDAIHGEQVLATRVSVDLKNRGDDSQLYSRYQTRALGSFSDKNVSVSMSELANMCERINLTKSIVTRGQRLLKRISGNTFLKGRSNVAIIASCIYISCRQEGVPRTFKEICSVSNVSKREIGRCFKIIVRNLETNIELVQSADFMNRFCSHLNLNETTQKAAIFILNKSVELDLVSGRSPVSLAAASIYIAVLAMEDKASFKEICETTGVSESTVRLVSKCLKGRITDIFPPNVVPKVPLKVLSV